MFPDRFSPAIMLHQKRVRRETERTGGDFPKSALGEA
jgi:hypothetical protein